MNRVELYGEITPHRMIEVKYERAKNICMFIWDKPKCLCDFEDIFHDTIYRCLKTLGNNKFDLDFMIKYFFKAFRINMIRFYGYSYNKLTSGIEIEKVVIPVDYDYENHMDGFAMLDFVEERHGKDVRDMLWENLNGVTYTELSKIYDTNTYYLLRKVKDELKRYYTDFKYKKLDSYKN